MDVSANSLYSALARACHHPWSEDDLRVVVEASQTDRLWALILNWCPELRPTSYEIRSFQDLWHPNPGIAWLRYKLWTSEALAGMSLTGRARVRVNGPNQRLFLRITGWMCLPAELASVQQQGSDAWAAIDSLADVALGVKSVPFRRGVIEAASTAPYEIFSRDMLRVVGFVQLGKMIGSVKQAMSEQRLPELRSQLYDLSTILEETIDAIELHILMRDFERAPRQDEGRKLAQSTEKILTTELSSRPVRRSTRVKLITDWAHIDNIQEIEQQRADLSDSTLQGVDEVKKALSTFGIGKSDNQKDVPSRGLPQIDSNMQHEPLSAASPVVGASSKQRLSAAVEIEESDERPKRKLRSTDRPPQKRRKL